MSQFLYVGTRKGLFVLTANAEGEWSICERAFLGVQVVTVLRAPVTGDLYAGLKHGHFGSKLQRSRDNGRTWEECATPSWPARPEDRPPDLCPVRNIEIPWSLELIWSLAASPDGETLWCGTIPGGLFRSDDGGDSWALNRPLWDLPERARWSGGGYDYPGIHSIFVDPNDGKRLMVGVSCGGVWYSEDGGASWHSRAKGMRAEYMPPEHAYDEAIQDPHRVAHCRNQPECAWSQHHNGIFYTRDWGQNWSEVTDVDPSTFGFAVVVHPDKPGTAWFVPAVKDEERIPADGKVVVTKTEDHGNSFTKLTNGLPQVDAYDLCYRHALDISDDGDLLALGSTTGSLWLSPDQGDSWQRLTAHLPPIYHVSFS